MNKYINITILFLFLLSTSIFFSQAIKVSDDDLLPLDCANLYNGGLLNFTDDNSSGDYGSNRRDTITFCPNLPDGGPKLSLTFGNSAGYLFDIVAQDTLYVFDGPNTAAPLLGAINSSTNPNGTTYYSSFENNPSGCFTVVFHSNATVEGAGWAANISCGNSPQPFYPYIEAYINGLGSNVLNTLDTEYIDICFGDSVLLVSKPLFPYSFETNGSGYSQNIDNITHDWRLVSGTTLTDNDSVWFKPSDRTGVYISLKITDAFPSSEQISCKIRVGQLASFSGVEPLVNPICLNEQGVILGGVSSTDTVGINFPDGVFEIASANAGLTYLPDGSGQVYSTTITMHGFQDDATYTSTSDLESICLNMEHSYLGDLEIWLTCPNGTQVTLINSNTGGVIPGGFDGGAIFLGDADGDGFLTPGIGWDYCFSSANATFGTMESEINAGNIIPTTISSWGEAMNPNGVYLPETSFSEFLGCPMNGDWTIFVSDNENIDDGYIFGWNLDFNQELITNTETYTNHITEDHWQNDPSIIGNMNDTAIVVLPNGAGTFAYTFVITDDFGCVNDTTIQITVKPGIELNMTSTICGNSLTATLNTGTDDGVWTSFSSPTNPVIAQNDINTSFTFPLDGVYNLVYSDTSCTDKDTAVITIDSQVPVLSIDDYTICSGETVLATVTSNVNAQDISWSNGSIGFTSVIASSGLYYVTTQSLCSIAKDSTLVTVKPKIILNMTSPICDNSLTTSLNTGTDDGVWTIFSSPTNPVVAQNDINTSFIFPADGVYNLVYSDTSCTDKDTVVITIETQVPVLSIEDYKSCNEMPILATLNSNTSANNIVWSNGSIGFTSEITTAGVYIITAQNSCGTTIDTTHVEFVVCGLDIPNIFTPGITDNVNNVFKVLEANDIFESFSCQIFNRWGNLIYEFKDVFGFWDGKDEKGDDANDGVYFYKVNALTFTGDVFELLGTVQLVR
ncbi:MAG: gliding motility-associated C-terminal domain-containing protein [Bacteroidota bacterium]